MEDCETKPSMRLGLGITEGTVRDIGEEGPVGGTSGGTKRERERRKEKQLF
jgi:hypothetical protein